MESRDYAGRIAVATLAGREIVVTLLTLLASGAVEVLTALAFAFPIARHSDRTVAVAVAC